MLKEFRDFLLRGNVIDLAVAVIIGAAFSAIVNSMVADIITPLIGAIGKVPDFSAMVFTLHGSQIKIGSFLNALISFLLMATVLFFFVVKPVNMAMSRMKKPTEPEAPATKQCPYCLSNIPAGAHRCPECTSVLDDWTAPGVNPTVPTPRM